MRWSVGSSARRWRSSPSTVAVPASRAPRSSSSIAAATHDGRSSPKGRADPASPGSPSNGSSALTPPPAPLADSKVPSPRARNRYGPRCVTSIMLGSLPRSRAKRLKQGQPVAQLTRGEEVGAHVLAALLAERVGAHGISEEIHRALRTLLDGVDEIAVESVADLQLDAAGPTSHDGATLPERFAHGQAEPFAQRLLQHDVGNALERIDLHRTDLVQIRQ